MRKLRLCGYIFSIRVKVGIFGYQVSVFFLVGKQGLAMGVILVVVFLRSYFFFFGDCIEESNQEVLIVRVGEVFGFFRLCVNEQCVFQKYLSLKRRYIEVVSVGSIGGWLFGVLEDVFIISFLGWDGCLFFVVRFIFVQLFVWFSGYNFFRLQILFICFNDSA